MMQVIRDKAQGIVAWVIVAIIAFVFCFWGVSSYLAPSGAASTVAEVNGIKITSAEIDDVYNRLLRMNADNPNFDVTQIDPSQIKRQITVRLAQQAAIISSLNKQGFTVTDSMLVQSIRSIPELQQDGKFSMELYNEYLAQMNIDETTFEAAHRDEMLLNQLQLAILASSFATEKEAERIMQLKDQKRDFGYAIIPAAKFVATAKVNDTEIEDYYNKHASQFVIPEQVQLEYIELSLDDVMKQIPVTDQKLREYYEANQASFNEPLLLHVRHIMVDAPKGSDADKSGEAHEKIEAIYHQLQLGGNFAELAKSKSEDKQSATSGGDLGWISKNDDYPAAVYDLKKSGQYTAPVQTDYGWHIFELDAIRGGGVKSYADVKDAVLSRYKREAAEKLFSSKGEELYNLSFENPTTLAVASEKSGLPLKTTVFFSRQDQSNTSGDNAIIASPNVVRAAFSEDVYEQGHNSELLRISDDNYVVIRVKDKHPEKQLSLAEVSASIRKQLQTVAAREQSKELGKKLLQTLRAGNNPNKATSSLGLSWRVANNIERDNKDINSALLQRAFAMPRPTEAQPVTTAGFDLPNGDYVVIALNKVTEGVVEKSADSNLLDMVTKQAANLNGRLEYTTVQDGLVEQANIKYMQR